MTRILPLAIGLATLALAGSAQASHRACPDPRAWGDWTHAATGAELLHGERFQTRATGNASLVDDCPRIHDRLSSDHGTGFFAPTPALTLDLAQMQGYRLRVSVVSDCDSTLLIQTGADNWYFDDDDNGNLDAMITLTRPSTGLFDIWVGTYDGNSCNATIYVQTY